MDFFVFGCPGLGTTWLAQTLDPCPAVQCLMETRIPLVLHQLEQLHGPLLEDPATHQNSADPGELVRDSQILSDHWPAAARHWANIAYAALRHENTSWLGDQHSFYVGLAPWLRDQWPAPSWIGIWRHPLATVASMKRRFDTPADRALAEWKKHARFLGDAVSRPLFVNYEPLERATAGRLRELVHTDEETAELVLPLSEQTP